MTTGAPTPTEAISVNTIQQTVSWPRASPNWASVAAPPTISSRFFGLAMLSATPAIAALAGVKWSSAPIHLGVATSSPSCGLLRHCRAASSTSARPRTSLTQYVQSAGVPFSFAFAGLASASTIAPPIPIPASQALRNAGPFDRACRVTSINTTATIGIGLTATPTANGISCPIAFPTMEILGRHVSRLFDHFEVVELPGLLEPRFEGAVEPEDGEP